MSYLFIVNPFLYPRCLPRFSVPCVLAFLIPAKALRLSGSGNFLAAIQGLQYELKFLIIALQLGQGWGSGTWVFLPVFFVSLMGAGCPILQSTHSGRPRRRIIAHVLL